jgi:anti-sigma factor RsiW
MCDKELIIGYLYGELQPSDREALDRHLGSCAECREEIDALRGTRVHLSSWTPPEPDLGFQIVRGPRAVEAPAVRRWRVSPAWGLAAAAMLMLAVSAAIANVEVQFGSLVVRTGWNRSPVRSDEKPGASMADLQQVQARMKELESQLAAARRPVTPAVSLTADTRPSDAELVRLVRRLIAESEERQQGVLARQILQVNRDVQVARQQDYDRLLYGMQRIQGTAVETSQRQKLIEDHLVRVGMQPR